MFCVVWKEMIQMSMNCLQMSVETEKKAIEFKMLRNLCVKNMIAE